MRFTDRKYLQNQQYGSPSNLDARIRLHDLYSVSPVGIHHWLMDRALERIPTRARILEVGAGHGRLWTANIDRIPPGWEIHLTDFSAGMLSAGKAALTGSPNSMRFANVDAQDLSFPHGTFDAVLAHFMLYHVPDRARAFAAFRRVLKPGGVLLAATLGRNHLKLIYEILEDLDPAGDQGSWELPFRLDNAAEELAADFTGITRIDFDDQLRVTEAEPLVAYILSMASAVNLDADAVAALRADIDDRLARDGEIRIPKESGILAATARP